MPIDSLPVEILLHIFRLHFGRQTAHNDLGWSTKCGLLATLILASVSSRWRTIALSAPSLWSSIDLRINPDPASTFAEFAQLAQRAEKKLELQLVRSGSSPLQLVAAFRHLSSAENFESLWRTMVPHLRRCESLALYDVDPDLIQIVFPLPPLPRIRHLALSGHGSFESAEVESWVDTKCSKLQLESFHLNGLRVASVPVASVRRLRLSGRLPHGGNLLDHTPWLMEWPGTIDVESLELPWVNFPSIPPEASELPILLPNVTSLRAQNGSICTYLSLPKLRTLLLDFSRCSAPLEYHVDLNIPSLHHLHIIHGRCTGTPLQGFPFLKTLVIAQPQGGNEWIRHLAELDDDEVPSPPASSLSDLTSRSAPPGTVPGLELVQFPWYRYDPCDKATLLRQLLAARPSLRVEFPQNTYRIHQWVGDDATRFSELTEEIAYNY